MISIIIPLYNKEKAIARAIDSVICQTYTDWECVIINDGSTDGSVDVVRTFLSNEKIRLIHQENGGVSKARNRGVKEAKGEWIFFLDADDYLFSDGILNLVIGKEKYENAHIICGNYKFSTETNIEGSVASFYKEGYVTEIMNLVYSEYLSLRVGVLLVKKEILLRVQFREDICVHEDTEMWLRLMKKCRWAYVDDVISVYCMSESELSKNRIDIRKEFAYYASNVKIESPIERSIICNNVACSIINRIQKFDFYSVLELIYQNKRLIIYIIFSLYKRIIR